MMKYVPEVRSLLAQLTDDEIAQRYPVVSGKRGISRVSYFRPMFTGCGSYSCTHRVKLGTLTSAMHAQLLKQPTNNLRSDLR